LRQLLDLKEAHATQHYQHLQECVLEGERLEQYAAGLKEQYARSLSAAASMSLAPHSEAARKAAIAASFEADHEAAAARTPNSRKVLSLHQMTPGPTMGSYMGTPLAQGGSLGSAVLSTSAPVSPTAAPNASSSSLQALQEPSGTLLTPPVPSSIPPPPLGMPIGTPMRTPTASGAAPGLSSGMPTNLSAPATPAGLGSGGPPRPPTVAPPSHLAPEHFSPEHASKPPTRDAFISAASGDSPGANPAAASSVDEAFRMPLPSPL